MLKTPNISPIVPQDIRVQQFQNAPLIIREKGLFYRQDIPEGAIAASQERLENGEGAIGDVQAWGQSAWKTRHGSAESVDRFGSKSLEEHGEFCDALEDFLFAQTDQNTARLHCEAVSELGDVVFSVTLLALNSSVDLTPALKSALGEYGSRTFHTQDGRTTSPSWQQQAIRLSKQEAPLTTADIDTLIANGFEPEPTTEDTSTTAIAPLPSDIFTQAVWMHRHLEQAIDSARTQYGQGKELDAAGATQVTAEDYQAHVPLIGRLVSKIYLEAAYIAQHGLGTNLTDVLQHTVSKISDRIVNNLVDKTDGERSYISPSA